jgi:ADP-ribose pyrophosphatase YjhB (NUDIX family)
MVQRATPYRDSAGKALEDYPRPSVAVDTAVLTVSDSARLSVLLTRTNEAAAEGDDEWRLPGTFLHPGETLSDAVLRSLREKAGMAGLRPRQLHVFDAPGRDDRGWVLSVAHLDVVAADRIRLVEHTRIMPVDEVPPLQFDHEQIIAWAVAALREEYRATPDPWALLGAEPFTMRDLRLLHEAIVGERFNPDTFRRTMLPGLAPTGALRTGARGKPAELYSRT